MNEHKHSCVCGATRRALTQKNIASEHVATSKLPSTTIVKDKESVSQIRPSLPEDARRKRRCCVSVRDPERKEDEATLAESESDDGDCDVMRRVMMRKPLDPKAGECVPAALDHSSVGTSRTWIIRNIISRWN